MMLENIGEVEAGEAVEAAVIQALSTGNVKAVTGDEGDTHRAGDMIAGLV